jgi:hypothetical protein
VSGGGRDIRRDERGGAHHNIKAILDQRRILVEFRIDIRILLNGRVRFDVGEIDGLVLPLHSSLH